MGRLPPGPKGVAATSRRHIAGGLLHGAEKSFERGFEHEWLLGVPVLKCAEKRHQVMRAGSHFAHEQVPDRPGHVQVAGLAEAPQRGAHIIRNSLVVNLPGAIASFKYRVLRIHPAVEWQADRPGRDDAIALP